MLNTLVKQRASRLARETCRRGAKLNQSAARHCHTKSDRNTMWTLQTGLIHKPCGLFVAVAIAMAFSWDVLREQCGPTAVLRVLTNKRLTDECTHTRAHFDFCGQLQGGSVGCISSAVCQSINEQ